MIFFVPSTARTLNPHQVVSPIRAAISLGLGDRFTEKPAEQIQWEFLSGTAEGGLVRCTDIGAFFVSQTGVTIESVYHLLVSEPLARTNHVDDEGDDDRKR
jgi:hypothetical protein